MKSCFFFHGHYSNWQRSSNTKTQFGNHPYLPTKAWSDMGKYFNGKKCWFTNKGWLTQFLSWTHLLGGKSLVISKHANKCPSLLSRLAKPCQHNKETELSCQSDTCKQWVCFVKVLMRFSWMSFSFFYYFCRGHFVLCCKASIIPVHLHLSRSDTNGF